jgi:hypothetical protein
MGCRDRNTNVSKEFDFNFIFKYGITSRNILDTYHGTFTKDMITAPGITIELTLTVEEMDSIYLKMVEIDFFHYPEEFKVEVTGEIISTVTPYSSYYFEVEYGPDVKILAWEDEITNPDEKADKLEELINLIINIIESKEEYKALPKANGGYI